MVALMSASFRASDSTRMTSLPIGLSHRSSVALIRSSANLGSWNQVNASRGRMAMSSVPSTFSAQ